MFNAKRVQEKISNEIEEVRHVLDVDIIKWVTSHIVEPRKITVTLSLDKPAQKEVWLITDHNNDNDSSYKIVFDPDTDTFGLVCSLGKGIEWYMGSYGSLYETIKNM